MRANYKIVDIFDTVQGEGSRTGHRSVFVRFAGCNLWSGDPSRRDLGVGACARWCDTHFLGGKRMTAEQIANEVRRLWPTGEAWVVLTGGEPLLQVDRDLVVFLHGAGIRVAVETNGTVESPALDLIDHVCVSPKITTFSLLVQKGTDLKVVLPGVGSDDAEGWTSAQLDDLIENTQFDNYYLQPQDVIDQTKTEVSLLTGLQSDSPEASVRYGRHLAACVDHIRRDPRWRLSLQTHKYTHMR